MKHLTHHTKPNSKGLLQTWLVYFLVIAFLNTVLFPKISNTTNTQLITLVSEDPVDSCLEFLIQGILNIEESIPDASEGDLDELAKETKDTECTLSRFFFCDLKTLLLFEINHQERTFFLPKRACIIYTPPPEV